MPFIDGETLRDKLNRQMQLGTLVYGRPDGSIMVQPFDPSRADTTGPATQLLQNVEQFFSRAPATGGFVNFDASAAGVLVYQPRPVGGGMLQVVQRDGAGRVPVSGRSWGPRFSPDGRRIAFGSYVTGLTLADVYTFDLAAKTHQRLTSGGQTGRDYNDPTWSPDGKWVALSGLDSAKASGKHLYLVRSDASAPPTRLLQRPGDQWPTDWTKDGKTVLFTDQAPDGKRSIWLVPAFGGGTPAPVVATMYNALGGRLSPDGRWLVYESDETGQPAIYVQPFPGPGPRIRVSLSGGQFPVWSHGGRELFYWFRDQLMAATLQLGGEASVTARTVLFRASLPVGTVLSQYDVQPGDQRFVISMPPTASTRLAVITGMAEPLTR